MEDGQERSLDSVVMLPCPSESDKRSLERREATVSNREVRNAWGKVGDELSGLGLKLKLHAEQEFSDDDLHEADAALEKFSEAIEAAVEAVENAVGDVAVREDVAASGRQLIEAMSVTMRAARRQIRDIT